MTTTGMGGSLTGRGGKCFVGETLIDTSIGKIRIDNLVPSCNHNIKVLTFNISEKKYEWNDIRASRRTQSREIVTIKTVKGKTIKCTPEHRIYSLQSGYKKASDFIQGEGLISSSLQKKQDMCNLWKAKENNRDNLSSMLSGKKGSQKRNDLLLLWEEFFKRRLCFQKMGKKRHEGLLLFSGMFKNTSFIQKLSEMFNLWTNYKNKEWLKILFKRLQAAAYKSKKIKDYYVRFLWQRNPAFITFNEVLFYGLQKQLSFRAYEEEQPKLSAWARDEQISKRISKEKISYKKRFNERMFNLFKERKSCYSSSGLQSKKQYRQQSGLGLQELPYNTSQIQTDAVSSITFTKITQDVYDIQVDGNNNFFANDILVHNCLIIDDPIKNAEEAFSETIRRKHKDWYQSTLRTRLEPDGAIVLVMTRWNTDDLAGWLLEEAKKEGGEQWEVLSLPAIAEIDNDVLGRKKGEALFPERFPIDALLKTKTTSGSYFWAAMYQQRPAPEGGNIIHREWLKLYNYKLARDMKFEMIIQSWDMSFKETNDSSYVVGQIWGKKGADKYLLDQVRRQMGFVDTLSSFRLLTAKWPQATAKLVEDKANGTAVMDTLKHEIAGIVAVEPEGSKVARAYAVSPQFEAGNIYIPDSALWAQDYIEELVAFPNAMNDDQMDATSQGIKYLINNVLPVDIEDDEDYNVRESGRHRLSSLRGM
jgi:predicted phage terminase large subunit-like protein